MMELIDQLSTQAMFVGVQVMGTDPMIFLTRVTAPFIFGTIVVLNMLQNSLFAQMAQPRKVRVMRTAERGRAVLHDPEVVADLALGVGAPREAIARANR